ncbi:hypothetical protein ACVWW1_007747 [Bradyrhizobium sp. JR3.5]
MTGKTAAGSEPTGRRTAETASGDDVGRDLIFDEGDAVAQLQLPLLQALQHQEIRRRRLMQRVDRGIEVAVLLLQTRKLGEEFALILIVHGCVLTGKHDEVVAAEAAARRNILPERARRKPNRFHSHD